MYAKLWLVILMKSRVSVMSLVNTWEEHYCNYNIYSVDFSEQATTNGEPAVTVQETKIDQPSDGVAVIGESGLAENSSEIKLLREESRESGGTVEDQSSQPLDRGVLNPISEEMENYPDVAAPYLVSYSTCLADLAHKLRR